LNLVYKGKINKNYLL